MASFQSRIPEIVASSVAKSTAAIEITLLQMEGEAKDRSRVDTGAMRAGWQHEMHGPFEGELFDPVEHTIYNEFGTVNMSAQPMATPAAEHAREPFIAAMREIYR